MTDAEILAMFADSINDGVVVFNPRQGSKEFDMLFDSIETETETETEEVTHA
jgi:hypothetical protein